MYEETKEKFNWKGFIIKFLIILAVFVLIIKLLPFASDNKGKLSKTFTSNMSKLKEVGNTYYTKETLPKNIDDSVKTSLEELIKNKKINTLKGNDGKKCNEEDSYIKAIKKSIGYELEVYLECGEEKDTSYVYLGCYDECGNTTSQTKKTTTTTTTTKKTTTKKTTQPTTKNNNQVTTTKKITKPSTTTTTTTRIKKYAVIFNVNGGSKVNMQTVVEGKRATKPADPTKYGFTFAGWYTSDNELYDFSKPVYCNTILIAKWYVKGISNTSAITQSYVSNVYSVNYTSVDSTGLNINNKLTIPSELLSKKNLTVKSIQYVRNITTPTDLERYKSNATPSIDKYVNTLNLSNIGTVNNVSINYQLNKDVININWTANITNKCSELIDNKCAYGIIYKITWKYTK